MYNGTSIVIITQYHQCRQKDVDLLSHVNTWWEPKSFSPLPLPRNSVDFDNNVYTKEKKTKQKNYQAKLTPANYYFSMDTAFLIDTRL